MLIHIHTDLKTALERLESVFSSPYQAKQKNHRSVEEIYNVLEQFRLQQLSESDIKPYIADILQLSCNDQLEQLSITEQLSFIKKIKYWTSTEKQILADFALNHFVQNLKNFPEKDIFLQFYRFQAKVFQSERFLQYWQQSDDIYALIAFAVMMDENQYFADDFDHVTAGIKTWLQQPLIQQHFSQLLKHFAQHPEIRQSPQLQDKIDYLAFYYQD
ncbi:hypothetical protein F4V57_05455 [Acinetobacter qingfengensis]|uniref:Uncharacterized protein n=1 Tax=Acinetobacter qingfengensis TaxID=1262585 RepID=A0A1E7RE17_9GAMM|nr:hypothetical protein [Acinetobacter qingfengensis]KAA8734410.1 hypothetical protein F4V57_05455 [Acinetobacter qingfengensis]OEY97581.1 hypothetical protein BJI46_08845 [Acinetobacter qingfengensis]